MGTTMTRRHTVFMCLLVTALARCGGSPTTPSAPGIFILDITSLSVQGSRLSPKGYSYELQVTVQNTGTAAGTVGTLHLTFTGAGEVVLDTRGVNDAFSGGPLQPGALIESRVVRIDYETSGTMAFAARVHASIIYGVGWSPPIARRTVDVPALPPPFELTGKVTELRGGALQDARVVIWNGPDAGKETRTDADGNYRLTGLQGGTLTVRASKSGYATFETAVVVSKDVQKDFSLVAYSGPS